MPSLVAFASLPFGVRGGVYDVLTPSGMVQLHVTDLRFNPFLSISSRPELAQQIPENGQGDGFTSYTWYDHPFVLRVVFGRNVASLGSINSCATVVQRIPVRLLRRGPAELHRRRDLLCETSLIAFNRFIAIVRRQARLYHVFDLQREDIDVTVRGDEGQVLREDPLQKQLIEEEEAHSETFDLHRRDEAWYSELTDALGEDRQVSLAGDLLIEAERALSQRFPRQSIATCHTAIEASASSLLTSGMLKRGLPDRQIDHVLSTKSLTSKLDHLLNTYTGFSLKRHNRSLWKSFNEVNDLRNDIVHRGHRPDHPDAERAIAVTREVLRWLYMVRVRNR